MTDSTKALVMVSRGLGLRDVIEHEGELLIVVLWFANIAEGLRKPGHVIPLASVPHWINDADPTIPARYIVNGEFPESLFLGTASRSERRRYGVRMGPDLTYPMPSAPTRH